MPSAEKGTRLTVALAGVLLLGAGSAGFTCTTTQEKAAWLKIRSARAQVAQKPVEVTTVSPTVKVVDAGLVEAGPSSAFVVEVRNEGGETANDLPISLEVGEGGKTVQVNRKPKTYFEAHLPALAPGESGTWVFAAPRPVPKGSSVSARIGVATSPPAVATDFTALDVSEVSVSGSGDRAELIVEVENPSETTQFDVPIYAWVKQGDRFVAAGAGSIDEISPQGTESANVELLGDPGTAEVQVLAPATIFE